VLRAFTKEEWVLLGDAYGVAAQALDNADCRNAITAGTVSKPTTLPGNGDPRDVIRDIFKRGDKTRQNGIDRDDGNTGAFAAAGTTENPRGYIRIGDPFFRKNIVGNLIWGPKGAPKLSDEWTRALVLLHEVKHLVTGDYSPNHDAGFNDAIYDACFKNLKLKKK
jgi:hypothetical protein